MENIIMEDAKFSYDKDFQVLAFCYYAGYLLRQIRVNVATLLPRGTKMSVCRLST
jgi:hypothetical protein